MAVPYGYCHCGCGELTTVSQRTVPRRGYVKGEPKKWLPGHNNSRPLHYVEEDRGYETPCWIWQRAQNGTGYGVIRHEKRQQVAHRVYYKLHVGPIPDGLQLGHLCRVRECVNPAHLEPVTNQENTLRGLRGRLVTHCKHGHEYTPENTYIRPHGRRECRACIALRDTGRPRWTSKAKPKLYCVDCGRRTRKPAIDLSLRAFCCHCAGRHGLSVGEHGEARSYDDWKRLATERQAA